METVFDDSVDHLSHTTLHIGSGIIDTLRLWEKKCFKVCSHVTKFSLIFPLSNFAPLFYYIREKNFGANESISHYRLNNGLKWLSGNIGLNFVMSKCSLRPEKRSIKLLNVLTLSWIQCNLDYVTRNRILVAYFVYSSLLNNISTAEDTDSQNLRPSEDLRPAPDRAEAGRREGRYARQRARLQRTAAGSK